MSCDDVMISRPCPKRNWALNMTAVLSQRGIRLYYCWSLTRTTYMFSFQTLLCKAGGILLLVMLIVYAPIKMKPLCYRLPTRGKTQEDCTIKVPYNEGSVTPVQIKNNYV